MSSDVIKRVLAMALLIAVQVLILNNVHILGVITPVIFGYGILCFKAGTSRLASLPFAFVAGLVYDIFSDTWGMGAASATLLAMCQPSLLNLFSPHDAAEEFRPDIYSMGFGHHLAYTFFGMLIFHTAFCLLNAFNVSDILLILIAIIGGAVISTAIIFLCELIIRNDKR